MGTRSPKGIGGRIEDGQSPIICENAFEAIVRKEQFAKAGEVIERRIKAKERNVIQYPLRNIIKCGNCKMGLERRCYKNGDVRFICSNSTNHKTSDCKRGRLIKEAAVETLVYNLISQYVDVLQGGIEISAVMVGGAPITDNFCKSIGADSYTTDAATAADVAISFL